jgi:hypothetical protein
VKQLLWVQKEQLILRIKESKIILKTLIKETIGNENRENNLIITGINQMKNENLPKTFSLICKKIGIFINPAVSIKRFKGINNPILVKFLDQKI